MSVKRFLFMITMSTVVLALFSPVINAADTVPPLIQHESVTTAASNSALTLVAKVNDDQRVSRVTMYVRTAGTSSYYALPAVAQADGTYKASVPLTLMSVGILEYYIEAVDSADNIATYPAVAAADNPQRIQVSKDTSAPVISLQSPSGLVGAKPFTVLIVLKDAVDNIKSDSIQVKFNDEDITKKARISSKSISFKVEAAQIRTRNEVYVSVTDIAGNESSRAFYLTQYPKISGSFDSGLAVSTKGADSSASLAATASWGGFEFRTSVQGDDPFFTKVPGPTKNNNTLSYGNSFLKLQLLDVQSTTSSLTVNSLSHKGLDVNLKLGPLETIAAYGSAKPFVAGESYNRRLIAFHQGLDLGFWRSGLSFSELIDEEPANKADAPLANPEQNYVLNVDTGLNIWKIALSGDAAASVYLKNARGNLWENVDQLPDTIFNFNLTGVKDRLNNIHPLVKELFPLPLDPGNVLASVEQYVHAVDVGGKVSLNTPLPFSTLSTSYFRYGPDFKTLGGSGQQDTEGYTVSLASDRIFGVLDMAAGYETHRNNLPSLLDLYYNSQPEGDITRTVASNGSMNIVTNLANTRLDYTRSDQLNEITSLRSSSSDTYSAKLSGTRYQLFGIKNSLSTGYSLTQAQQFTASGQPQPGGKQTTKIDVTDSFNRGAWQGNLSLNEKTETDNSVMVTSPSISLSNAWRFNDVSLVGLYLSQLKIDSDASYSFTVGKTGNDSLTSGLQLSLSPTKASSFSLKYGLSVTGDLTKPADCKANNTLTAKYRLSF